MSNNARLLPVLYSGIMSIVRPSYGHLPIVHILPHFGFLTGPDLFQPNRAQRLVSTPHYGSEKIVESLAVENGIDTRDCMLAASAHLPFIMELTLSSVMLFQKCSIFFNVLYGVQISITPR